jgi:hypothetical protein
MRAEVLAPREKGMEFVMGQIRRELRGEEPSISLY